MVCSRDLQAESHSALMQINKRNINLTPTVSIDKEGNMFQIECTAGLLALCADSQGDEGVGRRAGGAV